MDCVEAAVRPECGDEASDWQDEYVAKLHQPALDYIGCSGKIMRFSQLHSVQFLTPLGLLMPQQTRSLSNTALLVVSLRHFDASNASKICVLYGLKIFLTGIAIDDHNPDPLYQFCDYLLTNLHNTKTSRTQTLI